MMKLFSLLILVLMTSATYAAEEVKPPANDSKEVPAQQEKTVQPATVSTQAPADTFTPTETISEDLSVPFPVDI